jgi:gliding motility-associated-like protein
VNSSYTTPVLTTTTYYYVSIDNGTCESERTEIQAGISTCEPEPGFVWALGAGSGGGSSPAAKVLLTGDEDLLVFGSFSGTIDFDTGPGETILTSTVGSKVYMMKMDPDGTLLWAKAVGGNGNIGVADASMDAAGNYYLLITFNLTADFDPGAGVTSLTAIPSSPANKNDLAIAKYDADGNFIWVRSISGNRDEFAGGIESDADGNLYVTGAFRGTTNVGGSFSLTALGTNSTDILAASMDTNGNFLWAWNIGSNATTGANLFSDSGSDIAFDGTYLYISGRVYGPGTVDFDPGAGTAIETLTDGAAYILKLNTAGEYQNHHLIPGGAGNSIAVDNDGNVYATGGFNNTIDIDPGPGTFNVTSSGSAATYLVKLDPGGNFVWGASFTTWLNSVLMGEIFTDPAGDVYSTGYFQGTTDFDPGPLEANEESTGLFLNTFALKLDTDGNFKWVIAMRRISGGFTSASPGSLAVNSVGDVYQVGGFARHVDFDPSECTFEMNNVNGTDFFVRKVSPSVPTVCFSAEPINKFACTGSTITFATAVLGTDPYNFQWQKLNTSTSFYEDISNVGGYSGVTTPTLSINTTGDFGIGTYRCKVSGNTIIDDFSGSATLTIGPLTPPTVTGASTCTTEGATLTASGATAGQYRWYDVETGGTAIVGQVNSSFITPELSETTTFYVAINNGSCESERVPVTATLNATLDAPLASDVAVCVNEAALLTATGGADGQYRWYDADSGGTAFSGETNGVYTTPALSATSTYYVSINDGTCESARTAVVVTVNSPPSAPSTIDAVLCASGAATLPASGATDGQYRWYDAETGGIAFDGEINSTYTTPALSATTTYYVAINDGSCESARTAVTADINPTVTPPTATDVSICAPGSVTLTASGGAEGEYRWYDVETAGIAIPGEVNGSFTTPILSATTSYYVAINNGTCESSRTPVTVEIGSGVTPPTAVEVSTCPDESATLTATGGTDGSYRWYEVATGGAGIPNQVNSTLVTPALSSAATYYVAINDGTCESTRVPVAISLLQEAAFTSQPADQSVEVGEPASFSVTASGDNITYQWQKDLRNLEGETSAELVVAAVGLDSQGNYTCTISNDCGSQVSETAILTVSEPVVEPNGDEIIVYNAVAPNGNNKNDFFKIANIESHPGNSVEIYDRWGVKVFQVSDYDNQDSNARFEGRSNVGSSLNLVEGTYFYLIQASGQKLTGFLHLRR